MPEGYYKQGKPKTKKPAPKKGLFKPKGGFNLPTAKPPKVTRRKAAPIHKTSPKRLHYSYRGPDDHYSGGAVIDEVSKKTLAIHPKALAINRNSKKVAHKSFTPAERRLVHAYKTIGTGHANVGTHYGFGDLLHDVGQVAKHTPVVGGLIHDVENQPGIKLLKGYKKHALPFLMKHFPEGSNIQIAPGVSLSSIAPTSGMRKMQKNWLKGARNTFLGAPTIPLEVAAHPVESVKAIGHAVKNTFTDPLADPFTTSTIFIGGEGLIGGGIGRLKAVTGGAGRQAGRSAAKRATLTPIPEARPSGLLPSRNWGVNKWLIKRDEKTTKDIDVVAGTEGRKGAGYVNEKLSTRNKIGRLEQRRRETQSRSERAVKGRLGAYQKLEYDVDRLKPGFRTRAPRFDAITKKLGYKRLSPGELKVLDVASTGHLKDVKAHIRAHENELKARPNMPKEERLNHQAQLLLLRQAERHIAKPSKRLQMALKDVRATSHAGAAKKTSLPDEVKLQRFGAAHNQIESMAKGVKSHPERLSEIRTAIKSINSQLGRLKFQNKPIIARIKKLEEKKAKGKELTEIETKKLEVWKKSLSKTSHLKKQLDELTKTQDGLRQELRAEGAVALEKGAFYVPESPFAPLRPSSATPSLNKEVERIYPISDTVYKNYTGYARRHGTTRTDIVNAVHEDFNKTQIIVEKQRAHAFALEHSVKVRPEGKTAGDYIPVLKENIPPPELRAILTEPYRGRLTSKDRGQLEDLHNEATKHFFPDAKEIGRTISIDDVRWVNVRDLGDLLTKAGSGGFGNAVDIFNTLTRAGILYGQGPKYIVNLAQNMITASLRQGPMIFHNISVLKSLDTHYTDMIYALMEESRSRALYTGHAIDPYAKGIVSRTARRTVNAAMRGAHGTSEFWNRITDSGLRATAFLHEARVYGYNTPAKVEKLLDDVIAGDKKAIDQVNEFRHRADNEMVPFENSSHFEKEIVRRAFMFYPWLRGATIWTGKFPIEHPIQTALYSPVAQEGWDRYGVKNVPFWKEGQLLIGGHYTNPRAVTTPSTVVENVDAIKSIFEGGEAFSQIPATVGLTGISALLRPDTHGYAGEKSSPFESAWKATGGAIPGVQVYRNAKKKGALKAFEQSLVGQLSDVKATPYSGGTKSKKKKTPLEQLHDEIFGEKRGRKKKGSKTELEKLHDEIFGN